MQFVGVRGSGEHSGFGRTVGSVLSGIDARQSRVGRGPVDYLATTVDLSESDYLQTYIKSVKDGVRRLGAAVSGFRRRCKIAPIILAGWSQGAEVVDHWLRSARSRSREVVGIALFGDPRFNPRNGSPIDQGSYDSSRRGISQYVPRIGMFGGVERYPSWRRDSLRSYCAAGDEICNFTSPAELADCGRSSCAHLRYPDAKLGAVTYTQAGADFLLGRARAAMRAR